MTIGQDLEQNGGGESETRIVHARSMIDPNQRNNALVPESDVQAAVDVLLERAQTAAKQGEQQDGDGGLQKVIFESMLKHVSHIGAPVTDEAFHRFFFQMDEEEHAKKEHGIDDENMASAANKGSQEQLQQSQMDYTVFEMKDFDEEELIDMDALEQARKMRGQVRVQALSVARARDAVLQKAQEMIQQHIEQFRQSILRQDEKETKLKAQDREHRHEQLLHCEQAVQTMQLALQQTKDQLESTEAKLPVLVKKWETQMETLQEGERWGLSQTEQTIRSTRTTNLVPTHENLSVEDRVMSFLS